MNVIRIDEIKDDLIIYFKSKKLVPILGSGFSRGCPTLKGGKVPSGHDYKKHMLNELCEKLSLDDSEKETIEKYSFSKLCNLYEDDDNIQYNIRKTYMNNNFFKVLFDVNDVRKNILNIDWPYIYTLNIDDAIENNSEFKQVVLPKREIDEEIFDTEKCVIKLHGDISEIMTYKDSCKVFTTKEYVRSLFDNSVLLQKLKNDYAYQNILFLGCSLDDEIDLMSISTICGSTSDETKFNRKIIFVKDEPERVKLSDYKQFGITDIVYFDSYDIMYEKLFEIWMESNKITKSELDSYNAFHITNLINNSDENKGYFFHGKSLIDNKKKEMYIPYFYTKRNLCEQMLRDLDKNTVHIVKGNRISGKSYFMADIYRNIVDREVYFFDSKTRLTNETLNILLNKTRIVCLFDSSCLNKSQFTDILLNFITINENKSNFIISVNESDVELLSILNWKSINGEIDRNKINQISLSNKFNSDETDSINIKLPKLDFPPFSSGLTILDNIIKAEKTLNVKGRFSKVILTANTYKELAFFIILATKEKLYSSELIMFGLETEAYYAVKKYSPFIEIIDTDLSEKSPSDLSGKKYVLNAKYWLYRQLGMISSEKTNYELVARAYVYIVEKILNKYKNNPSKQRRNYKSYILFDTINSIFLKEQYGQLPLIVFVYDKLHALLANDYNFLHQNAKCFLRYSQNRKNPTEKGDYLNNALRKAKVSYALCDEICTNTNNESMFISLAHIQFTIAVIYCELCKFHEYMIKDEINETIEYIHTAVKNPYYLDIYRNDIKNKSIIHKVINHFMTIDIDKESNQKLNDIINIIIK